MVLSAFSTAVGSHFFMKKLEIFQLKGKKKKERRLRCLCEINDENQMGYENKEKNSRSEHPNG